MLIKEYKLEKGGAMAPKCFSKRRVFSVTVFPLQTRRLIPSRIFKDFKIIKNSARDKGALF